MQLRQITARYGRKRQPAQYESAEAMIEFTLSVDEDGAIGTLDVLHTNMGAVLLGQAKTLVLTELGVVKAGQSASAYDNQPLPASAKTLSVGDGEQTGDRTEPAPPAATGEKKARGSKKKDTEQQPQASGDSIPSADSSPTAPAASTPTASAAGIPDAAQAQSETALGRSIPASAPGNAAPKPNGSAADIPSDVSAASVPQPAAAPQTQVSSGAAAGAIKVDVSLVQKYVADCLAKKKFLPPVVLGKLKKDYQVERVGDLGPEKLHQFYNEIRKAAGDDPV